MKTELHTKKTNPWDNEPDELLFEHLGYTCLIKRGPRGTLNGYCFIPYMHPWYKLESFEKVDSHMIQIHGGITCDIPTYDNIKKQRGRVLGFDTGNKGDTSPYLLDFVEQSIVDVYTKLCEHSDGTAPYKDMAFVKKECEFLAQKLKDNEGS